jgi:RIO kinase 1
MTRDEYEILIGQLETFLDESLILEILEVVKGGKEATVFRCRAAPSTKQTFFAAKVYRPMDRRNFRNDSVYQHGRVITNRRNRRAVEKRSDFGREVQFGGWVNHEYQTQQTLYHAGADVPRPWACNGSAILMEWIGDEAAAVQLRHADFASDDEVVAIHRRLIENIRLMLSNNLVHGDLSPFNILYLGNSQVRIIDFPQAVDARSNRNACSLLFRDVENVCRFFEKFGVRSNPGRIAADFWSRFLRADL